MNITIQMKMEIHRILNLKDLNAYQFGILLGLADTEARRILNLKHPTKVQTLENILKYFKVDCRLVFEERPAKGRQGAQAARKP